jgi:hypothetical protein
MNISKTLASTLLLRSTLLFWVAALGPLSPALPQASYSFPSTPDSILDKMPSGVEACASRILSAVNQKTLGQGDDEKTEASEPIQEFAIAFRPLLGGRILAQAIADELWFYGHSTRMDILHIIPYFGLSFMTRPDQQASFLTHVIVRMLLQMDWQHPETQLPFFDKKLLGEHTPNEMRALQEHLKLSLQTGFAELEILILDKIARDSQIAGRAADEIGGADKRPHPLPRVPFLTIDATEPAWKEFFAESPPVVAAYILAKAAQQPNSSVAAGARLAQESASNPQENIENHPIGKELIKRGHSRETAERVVALRRNGQINLLTFMNFDSYSRSTMHPLSLTVDDSLLLAELQTMNRMILLSFLNDAIPHGRVSMSEIRSAKAAHDRGEIDLRLYMKILSKGKFHKEALRQSETPDSTESD